MLKVFDVIKQDTPIYPTHQIHFYIPEGEYTIVCGHKNCFVKENVNEDDLQDIVETFNKQDEKLGYVEGRFAFDCDGVYFIHA